MAGYGETMMITICGAEWEIIEDSSLIDDGQCDYNTQVIRINPHRHPRRVALSLVHELLHVVMEQAGLGTDEKLVARLEHGVCEIVKNFPKKYLEGGRT